MSDIGYLTFVEPAQGRPGQMTFTDAVGNPWQPVVNFGTNASFQIQVKSSSNPCRLKSLIFWFGDSQMARNFVAGQRFGTTLEFSGVSVTNVDTSSTNVLSFDVSNHLTSKQPGEISLEVTVESPATGNSYTSRDPQITLRANEGGP